MECRKAVRARHRASAAEANGIIADTASAAVAFRGGVGIRASSTLSYRIAACLVQLYSLIPPSPLPLPSTHSPLSLALPIFHVSCIIISRTFYLPQDNTNDVPSVAVM